jgi:hypothetical protein
MSEREKMIFKQLGDPFKILGKSKKDSSKEGKTDTKHKVLPLSKPRDENSEHFKQTRAVLEEAMQDALKIWKDKPESAATGEKSNEGEIFGLVLQLQNPGSQLPRLLSILPAIRSILAKHLKPPRITTFPQSFGSTKIKKEPTSNPTNMRRTMVFPDLFQARFCGGLQLEKFSSGR